MKKFLSIAIIAGIFTLTSIQAAETSAPSTQNVLQDNGYVNVQAENLNEEVQSAINEFSEEYEVKSIQYNATQNLTKVEYVKRDDQSTKTVVFRDSGEKVENDREGRDANVNQQQRELQQRELEHQQEGEFFEERQHLEQQQHLEQRQQRELEQQQEGEQQRELQQEGQQQRELEQQRETEQQQLQQREQQQQTEQRELEQNELQRIPSAEMSIVNDDDKFENVKFEDLNENVQNAIREISGEWEVTEIKHSSEKGLTKVKATNKEDQTEKKFLFDNEGSAVEKDSDRRNEKRNEE